MEFRAIVLAAGESKRAGSQKLLAAFRGRRLIDYAIEAALPWRPIVVASNAVARALQGCDGITTVRNERPELGMSYSLKLGHAAVTRDCGLIVVLGDKPLIRRELIAQVCSTRMPIAYPVHWRSGEPGHPVVFDVCVRQKICSLRDGDTLHRLRDDPAFLRCALPTSDDGAFFDVDLAEQLA